MEHRDDVVTLAGTRIHVMRGGTGAPLVFLHGAGGHPGWSPFLDRMAQGFEVIAPEHPGFGRSDDRASLAEIADLADFYRDLLRALGLARVHLVGASLGGWIAAELAVRSTARLATLTLVGAVGITAQGEPVDDLFRLPLAEDLERYYADPATAARRLQAIANADPAAGARNRATAMRLADRQRYHNPDLAQRLHRIDVPTLLVWGEADGLVPPRFGEAYQAAIPGSRLVVVPDAGHAPYDEQPDAFLAAFRAFLAGSAPGA
jgi:pimeloyl-ACP methyl ester carboxylesterase